MTPEQFQQTVKEWLATAKHPRYNCRYDELVYQPMLEVLAYMRANGFKTFIASGGGIEFIRAFAEERYGIPPEQVVGRASSRSSSGATAGRPCFACRKSISSMTVPANPWVSTSISAAVRLPRSGTPTVISRCCNGRPHRADVAWAS